MDSHPKEIVEALLMDALASITEAVNALALTSAKEIDTGKLTLSEMLRGLYSVCGMETSKIQICLTPYHKASLTHKHGLIRDITDAFRDYLGAVFPDSFPDDDEGEASVAFLEETLRYITAYHTILLVKTPRDERSKVARGYLSDG